MNVGATSGTPARSTSLQSFFGGGAALSVAPAPLSFVVAPLGAGAGTVVATSVAGGGSPALLLAAQATSTSDVTTATGLENARRRGARMSGLFPRFIARGNRGYVSLSSLTV